jgi:ferric-dicitrate binding protein FerR (iron transport regulator)
MSTDIAYELQSFSGGRWKIQGFFDDRDLAVSEAHRMEEARRFPAVRVIEERFDPETGGYKSRTVYRSSAVDQHNETALKERADTRREVEATRTARPEAPPKAAKPQSSSPALTMIAVKAVLLFALGFAAIWAINRYGGI